MNKLTILMLALMAQFALAQQLPTTPYDGEWDCTGHTADQPLRVCNPFCNTVNAPVGFTAFPLQMTCPDSEFGSPGDTEERCAALLNQTPPLCCPPGTVCSRNAPTPTPGASSSSNNNKALIAGGVVVAGIALYHAFSPPLPEGLTLEPTAHMAYRDGVPISSAALRGSYGDWSFSVSSVHTGHEWSKPYARMQWAWAF